MIFRYNFNKVSTCCFKQTLSCDLQYFFQSLCWIRYWNVCYFIFSFLHCTQHIPDNAHRVFLFFPLTALSVFYCTCCKWSKWTVAGYCLWLSCLEIAVSACEQGVSVTMQETNDVALLSAMTLQERQWPNGAALVNCTFGNIVKEWQNAS